MALLLRWRREGSIPAGGSGVDGDEENKKDRRPRLREGTNGARWIVSVRRQRRVESQWRIERSRNSETEERLKIDELIIGRTIFAAGTIMGCGQ